MQSDPFGDNDNNLIVRWWERNATNSEPVLRISIQIMKRHLGLY